MSISEAKAGDIHIAKHWKKERRLQTDPISQLAGS